RRPPLNLVVVELRKDRPERRDLGVLVHLVLPPEGYRFREALRAPDQRGSIAQPLGERFRFVLVDGHVWLPPGGQLLEEASRGIDLVLEVRQVEIVQGPED